ncbi:Nucleolar protein 12 [Bienertia sinuspersici]
MEAMAEGAVVGQPSASRGNHINKRALRNKSLSVSFNEKDLRDYVGGFHKRKKKRRKEALKQQEVVKRRKLLEDRKRRRKERQHALYGDAPPDDDAKSADEDLDQNDEIEMNPSISGTTSYDNGNMMVTVTTSEITHEEEEEHPIKKSAPLTPISTGEESKKHNIPVSKKKSTFKKGVRGKSRTKLLCKRDRRNGKKTANKRKR